jgi:hypothetical protein
MLVAAMLTVTGCAGEDGPGDSGPTNPGAGTPATAVTLPPEGTGFDYQLGGAYSPPEGTGIVVRDSTAEPEPGIYSVCDVNGFQTQPGEEEEWDDLVLVVDGEAVVDPDWPDEVLLDSGSETQRQEIAERLAPVITGCAEAGFDAVEFDNLDSYTRSRGALTLEDNLELARLLGDEARNLGLAVAQKNTPEAGAQSADLFDFAITEDCGAFDECDAYSDAYAVVLDIEYATGEEFADLCAAGAVPATAIRRDLGLVAASAEGYEFERCAVSE